MDKEVIRLAADKIMESTTEEEKIKMLENMIEKGALSSSDPLIKEIFRRFGPEKIEAMKREIEAFIDSDPLIKKSLEILKKGQGYDNN